MIEEPRLVFDQIHETTYTGHRAILYCVVMARCRGSSRERQWEIRRATSTQLLSNAKLWQGSAPHGNHTSLYAAFSQQIVFLTAHAWRPRYELWILPEGLQGLLPGHEPQEPDHETVAGFLEL